MVGAVVAGDSDAVGLFVCEYTGRIQRAVREAGVPSSDFEDVAQDILIEALRQLSLNRFQYRSSLRTWVRHVTEGRIADYWRARGRRGRDKTVPLESIDASTPNFLTPAAQEARLLVQEALAAMPVRHRLAITAHFRAGMPVDELARVFSLSVPRTRNIITEAKTMFRRAVRGVGKTRGSRRLIK